MFKRGDSQGICGSQSYLFDKIYKVSGAVWYRRLVMLHMAAVLHQSAILQMVALLHFQEILFYLMMIA